MSGEIVGSMRVGADKSHIISWDQPDIKQSVFVVIDPDNSEAVALLLPQDKGYEYMIDSGQIRAEKKYNIHTLTPKIATAK